MNIDSKILTFLRISDDLKPLFVEYANFHMKNDKNNTDISYENTLSLSLKILSKLNINNKEILFCENIKPKSISTKIERTDDINGLKDILVNSLIFYLNKILEEKKSIKINKILDKIFIDDDKLILITRFDV